MAKSIPFCTKSAHALAARQALFHSFRWHCDRTQLVARGMPHCYTPTPAPSCCLNLETLLWLHFLPLAKQSEESLLLCCCDSECVCVFPVPRPSKEGTKECKMLSSPHLHTHFLIKNAALSSSGTIFPRR